MTSLQPSNRDGLISAALARRSGIHLIQWNHSQVSECLLEPTVDHLLHNIIEIFRSLGCNRYELPRLR